MGRLPGGTESSSRHPHRLWKSSREDRRSGLIRIGKSAQKGRLQDGLRLRPWVPGRRRTRLADRLPQAINEPGSALGGRSGGVRGGGAGGRVPWLRVLPALGLHPHRPRAGAELGRAVPEANKRLRQGDAAGARGARQKSHAKGQRSGRDRNHWRRRVEVAQEVLAETQSLICRSYPTSTRSGGRLLPSRSPASRSRSTRGSTTGKMAGDDLLWKAMGLRQRQMYCLRALPARRRSLPEGAAAQGRLAQEPSGPIPAHRPPTFSQATAGSMRVPAPTFSQATRSLSSCSAWARTDATPSAPSCSRSGVSSAARARSIAAAAL